MVNPSNQPPTATVLVAFQQRAAPTCIGDCLREAGYVVAIAKGYDDALRTLVMACGQVLGRNKGWRSVRQP